VNANRKAIHFWRYNVWGQA